MSRPTLAGLYAFVGAMAISLHLQQACTPAVQPLSPADGAHMLGTAKTLLECEDEAFKVYADAGRDAGLSAWTACKSDGGL